MRHVARNRPEETQQTLVVYRVGDVFESFAPWKRSEVGKQVYVKLIRGDETSFVFVGNESNLRSELQQALMRLVNDGWSVEGELTVSFDGRSEPGTDPYVYQDPLVVELGRGLLPLADPQNGTPLAAQLEQTREEVARDVGLVLPSVRVVDNLQLDPQQYVIRIKGAPVATGELFLDRYLVVAPLELLANLEGWTTQDPVHRLHAKWVEAAHKEKAEGLGCLVLGPLSVMMTHIKTYILSACPDLLGLQETYDLIARLRHTHPIVVEDFLADRVHLRRVRRVLQSLLAERVPIRDLVTVLEICGEYLDRLHHTDRVVEQCRQQLARQICSSYVNSEGVLRALALGPLTEQVFAESIQEGLEGPVLLLTNQQVEDFLHALKKSREAHGFPSVLFTDPPTRAFVQRVVARAFPDLGVIATSEIAAGFKVEVCASLEPFGPQRSLADDGLA